jgi:hypothetical protein
MTDVFGMPQPLTGSELVTIYQEQNGQLAKCSMPLSEFVAFIMSSLASSSTTEPSTKGVLWNNAGAISVS